MITLGDSFCSCHFCCFSLFYLFCILYFLYKRSSIYTTGTCSICSDKTFRFIFLPKPRNTDHNTVKPVLSGHSKIDKTKVLLTNGSLMKVESITECILQYF